ncbi:MAG: VWA domain-containing protein [Phycisphaerae bacterium]|nr:VWA domain-containing protein [Tepidisphaeraceae bacterium]
MRHPAVVIMLALLPLGCARDPALRSPLAATSPVAASRGPATDAGSTPVAGTFACPALKAGTGLFGVGTADRVVFCIDASGSMIPRFLGVRDGLWAALGQLAPKHSFNVVCFSSDTYFAVAPKPIPATAENLRKARDFLTEYNAHGSSDPIPALRAAFAGDPQLVVFLTDGDFANNRAVFEEIRRLNARRAVKARVSTVAYQGSGDTYQELLRQIATDNGGQYRFVGP